LNNDLTHLFHHRRRSVVSPTLHAWIHPWSYQSVIPLQT